MEPGSCGYGKVPLAPDRASAMQTHSPKKVSIEQRIAVWSLFPRPIYDDNHEFDTVFEHHFREL